MDYDEEYSIWLFKMGLWEVLDMINQHRDSIKYKDSDWIWCFSKNSESFYDRISGNIMI